MTTGADLETAIDDLGLVGGVVAVHVSLRSFPSVEGGPATLVDAFLARGCTLIIPTMANEFFGVPAPRDDRPRRNGTDYAAKDDSSRRSPWPGLSDIYDATRTETDPDLGATAAHVAQRPDRVRCARPAGSFTAVGPRARDLIAAETSDDVYGPLRRVVELQGHVLLMGVSLTRMTMLHLAELEAGRRPFVHWARGPQGHTVRVMGGKCSDGFEHLAAALQPCEKRTVVGRSEWRLFEAACLINAAAAAIRAKPSITHCGGDCLECDDAVAGGPLD